jgi:hypothetical protein
MGQIVFPNGVKNGRNLPKILFESALEKNNQQFFNQFVKVLLKILLLWAGVR